MLTSATSPTEGLRYTVAPPQTFDCRTPHLLPPALAGREGYTSGLLPSSDSVGVTAELCEDRRHMQHWKATASFLISSKGMPQSCSGTHIPADPPHSLCLHCTLLEAGFLMELLAVGRLLPSPSCPSSSAMSQAWFFLPSSKDSLGR